MCEKEKFLDILEPRKTQSGIFRFMSKAWYPKRSQVLNKIYSPQDIKDAVANSMYLDAIIETESSRSGVNKEKLRKEVLKYIDEIGMDKKLHIFRWMGIFSLKIAFMMNIGIYVNEPAVLHLKSTMGKNPVLFLPTHRSYADFCVLTYLCYHYDIEFPAVATGMDFYSMAVIGQLLRECSAFYIRRTLAGAPLYAATLKQYVRALVAKHCAPIEFFLEGTRSRSNKSLPPKYGMLSMSLMPLFAREVPDVTVVPVNISYDRLMEQNTFAYELLGVPKPKESTKGLLKWISTLNGNFGNLYINFGAPISVMEFLGDVPPSPEAQKPVDLQTLTPEQFKQVQDVADYTVTQQQANSVATISNLLALVLTQSLLQQRAWSHEEVLAGAASVAALLRGLGATVFEDDLRKNVDRVLVVQASSWTLDKDSLLQQRAWSHEEVLAGAASVAALLRGLGATVFEDDLRKNVDRVLVVQASSWTLDKDRRLRIIASPPIEVTEELKKKMKGHTLKAETMATAIPIIQLQMYVNPTLHYLAPPGLICVLTQRGPMPRDELARHYHQLRKLLRHEFFHVEKSEEKTFQAAFEFCSRHDVVRVEGGLVDAGASSLRPLLRAALWPALATLLLCADTMTQEVQCTHTHALRQVQCLAEATAAPPACLSLDSAAHCLAGLVLAGALRRDKSPGSTAYILVPAVMRECRALVASVLPALSVPFDTRNPVVMDYRAKARL